MSRTFVDANVFLAGLESQRSIDVPELLYRLKEGVTSTLVILEVLAVSVRRFEVPYATARRLVKESAARLECVEVPLERLYDGIQVARTNRLDIGLIDAVHVATALRAGCEEFLSEDLAHNTWYGGSLGEVLVVNPFVPKAPAPRSRKANRRNPRVRANQG